MKRHTTAICALLALTVPAVASADEIFASLGTTTAYYTHHSFDAISESNAMPRLELVAGVGLESLPNLRFLLSYGTTFPVLANRFAGDLDARWEQHRLLAHAEYGLPIGQYVRPFARLGVGYAQQKYTLLRDVGPDLRDFAHDLAAQASVGVALRFPLSFGAIGLLADVGYDVQTNATFDELRHKRKAFEERYEPDDDPWTREQASVGSLQTHGFAWNGSLFFEFNF